MDVEGFLAGLPALFADFPRSQVPRDRSLATVVEQVDGLSEENNLALLALAARHLGDGECYLEAGAYHGRTLIGVATGSAASCVAIDNFSYDGVSRASLTATLDRFGVADRVRVVDADTGDALDTQDLPPVGVFFYDAEHSTGATLEALRRSTRHLAGRALIVVDDADWDDVRAAVDTFLAEQPRATLRLRIAGRSGGQPWWWDGMDLIEWSATNRGQAPSRTK